MRKQTLYRHAARRQSISAKARFRLDKNAADAKLENTSLSTGVFITAFVRNAPPAGGWVLYDVTFTHACEQL